MSRITLPILDAVTLTAACTQIVADARAAFERLAALPLDEVSPATVLDEWDRIGLLVENIEGPVSILNNVHPDKAVRDAADEAIRALASFQVEIFQNEALYARVQAVVPSTPSETQLRKDLVESFDDTGVTLAPDRRARAKAIADRITALYQEFSRNLRDNQSRMAFTADEMRGLPEPFLSRQPRDEQGRYLLSFDYPDFNPFMANAEDEDARRRYYVAYLNRGTGRNVEILDEVMALRHELAGLYTLPSFAHFVLRRRMAGTPETVDRFLNEVRAAVEEAERQDIDELRALKAARLGRRGQQVAVTRWDIAFLSERLREKRYNVDQESLRKYFPPQATLDWLLDVSGEVFGLRFVPGQGPGVARRRALRRRARPGGWPVHRRHLLRSLPARGQVPARGRLAGARRQHPRQAHAGQRAGDQLRSARPDPRRGRDAVPRVRPHPARRAVGDRVQLPRRHQRAARLRRDALADLRGVDAPARQPRPHAPGLARHAGDGRQPGRAAQPGAALRPGPPLRAAVALRVVRSGAHRPDARGLDGRVGTHGRRDRAGPRERAPRFRGPSRTSSAATPPGTTATCGPRSSPSTCSRPSATR